MSNESHEFDFEICTKRIRPIAEGLIRKYPELKHIDPEKILFVVNNKSAGSKKKIILARTYRIPMKWAEIIYQIAAVGYFHVMEFYAKTTAVLDENQMVALVYRELRTIGAEGQIVSPDVHDWWQMLMGLGRNWFYPDATCPNLLDENVDWRKLMGTYYEEPRAE